MRASPGKVTRVSPRLEQSRRFTALARSESGLLGTIGSYLLHNGFSLRKFPQCCGCGLKNLNTVSAPSGQLDKGLSLTDELGKMTCRYGPDKVDLRAALAQVREAVEAIDAAPNLEWDFEQDPSASAEYWWDTYSSALWDMHKKPTQEQSIKFEKELRAKQKIGRLAALDRMAAKVESMTEAEANRHDFLRVLVKGETEVRPNGSKADVTVPVLECILGEFFHGADGHRGMFGGPKTIKFPLVYPRQGGGRYEGDLSPVRIMHDGVSGDVLPQTQQCSHCKQWVSHAVPRWCAAKYCGNGSGPEPLCGVCFGLTTCSTCSKVGCPCRFVGCSNKECTNSMCNCQNFGGYKMDDSGQAPGCALFVYDEEDEDSHWDAPRFCVDCAPPDAQPDGDRDHFYSDSDEGGGGPGW